MATSLPSLRLFITSFHQDFSKERDLIFSQVIGELEEWCESQGFQLFHSDIRWGDRGDQDRISCLKDDILSSNKHFFLNLSSVTLGLVPSPDDHPPDWIHSYRSATGLQSDEEYFIVHSAYSTRINNSLLLLRDDSFLDYLLEEEEQFFVKKNLVGRPEKPLTELLPESQIVHYKYDTAGWDWGSNRLEVKIDAAGWTHKVMLKLKQSLLEYMRSSCSSGTDTQTAFMLAYSANVRGREAVIEQVESYVESGGSDVPLFILGGEGSGKTAVMTKLGTHLQARLDTLPCPESSTWRLFCHCVGATPGSTELLSMLNKLLVSMNTVTESGLPSELNAAACLCCSALSNPNTPPIIIVVDAINQFDKEPAADIVSWLPRKLAPQVRCIISSINDSPQHETLSERETKPQELHLEPLPVQVRRQIICDILAGSQRALSDERISLLLTKQSSQNPLWLSVACEELSLLTSSKALDQRLHSLPMGLLNLLEQVLMRFEQSAYGELIVAALCLLEASKSGLLEGELLLILADETCLSPPSPFEEKGEKELSEKAYRQKKSCPQLAENKWTAVYDSLRPFIRPFGMSREGRLYFYHTALRKAVRRRYFNVGEENQGEESPEIRHFWHQKLASFFQSSHNMDRKAEEYLYQLFKLEDTSAMVEALADWQIFDRLYSEEFATKMHAYWRLIVGGTSKMTETYRAGLTALEAQKDRDERLLSRRYEHVARIFLQAGCYSDALELGKISLKWEEKDLGARPERMVDLYSLMAEIYDEKLKLNDFVSASQLPDLRKTISYGRKSIELRKTMNGPHHQYKLGMSLMKLAFSLESWEACGGDRELTGAAALSEGNRHIDTAIAMFKELKDMGHYAEAVMTKGVLAPRGSSEQLKHYNEAMEICRQVFGENSLLASRLYINIGIVYEDNKDYVKAYEYFKKWAKVSEVVLGPNHPKTIRAKGVLKEPRYQHVAQRLKDMEEHVSDNSSAGNTQRLTEDVINQEAGELDPESAQSSGIMENRDVESGQNLQHVTLELQQALNDLLTRTLGEVDLRSEVLQNILNTVQTYSASGGIRESRDDSDHEDSDDDHPAQLLPPPSDNILDGDNDEHGEIDDNDNDNVSDDVSDDDGRLLLHLDGVERTTVVVTDSDTDDSDID